MGQIRASHTGIYLFWIKRESGKGTSVGFWAALVQSLWVRKSDKMGYKQDLSAANVYI